MTLGEDNVNSSAPNCCKVLVISMKTAIVTGFKNGQSGKNRDLILRLKI